MPAGVLHPAPTPACIVGIRILSTNSHQRCVFILQFVDFRLLLADFGGPPLFLDPHFLGVLLFDGLQLLAQLLGRQLLVGKLWLELEHQTRKMCLCR